MSLLAVHPGAAYHIESLEGPRYRRFFRHLARPEELGGIDLAAFDTVLVPCRTPADRMMPHRRQLEAFLAGGGTVVATGESDSELWLPGIAFTPQPTNWWWWLDPKGDLGVRIADPDHPLIARLGPAGVTWHLHGTFVTAPGAEILVADTEGRAVLYIDEVTTAGRMIITSLDPFYHHGSHFMPATTRFLDGFLPWLTATRPGSGDAAERAACAQPSASSR